MASNRRLEPRFSTQEKVRIYPLDHPGGSVWLRGQCVSISRSGLQVELDQSLPDRSAVSVELVERGVRVTATVRYSMPFKLKYRIGLECVWGDKIKFPAETVPQGPDQPQPPPQAHSDSGE